MSGAEIQTIQLTQTNTTNSKNNQMKMRFPFPFVCENKEMALSSLYIYYSWRNVTASYGNNSCSYTLNGTTYPVAFPDGYYSITDINNFIHLQMTTNGHYLLDSNGNPVYYLSLVSNPVYYSVTLTATPIPTVLPTGYTNPHGLTLSGLSPQLNITGLPFGTLIGFTVASYPAAASATVYQANSNITAQISPISSINVNTNMVNNAALNSLSPASIYTFSPNVSYTQQIQVVPQNLLWFKTLDQTYQYIEVQFQDQQNRDVPILDTNITVTLLIRDCEHRLRTKFGRG